MIENSDIGCNKPIIECCSMSTKLQGIPENIFSADEFVGNKVIDREGIQYGKVKHIHINPDTLIVSGVTIHEGFRKDFFLSSDYFDKFTDESLLLNIPPLRKGLPVVDIDGHKIGTIKKLHRDSNTNELESIEVSAGVLRKKILPKSQIWGVGETAILKMTKDEFKKFK